MRVSQRLDYALRALVMLAERPDGEHVAAGELADGLALPRRFVEQQITSLSHAGIVTCRRGATGGCALARPAAEVSVADVVQALHGEVLDVPRQRDSATAELWEDAAASLEAHLSAVTLDQLAARQRQIDAESHPMYYI
jgi:Rrf2 family protein